MITARFNRLLNFKLALAILLVVLLSGCETLQFYRQAAWGQWQLLQARQPLAELVADDQLDPKLRQQLQLAQDILAYGDEALLLVPDGRYTSYVHLDRQYVVWNVFAAPPFELSGRQWCYPFVGCAPYRGYFSAVAAQRAADKFTAQGLETYVGGVPAYSTLGWFEDPLLSTFIHWPEANLASLLLHEMAHSKVWVSGDVAFNESFAEFVGIRGAHGWLDSQLKTDEKKQWLQRREGWRGFREFTLMAKAHLEQVYSGTPLPNSDQLVTAQHKASAMAGLRACYDNHREHLGGGRYDQLMNQHFNNAFLVSVGTYADWLPAFNELFARHGERWADFYAAVEALGELDDTERLVALTELTEQPIAERADDQYTHQVNCEPFLGHGADGEPAG